MEENLNQIYLIHFSFNYARTCIEYGVKICSSMRGELPQKGLLCMKIIVNEKDYTIHSNKLRFAVVNKTWFIFKENATKVKWLSFYMISFSDYPDKVYFDQKLSVITATRPLARARAKNTYHNQVVEFYAPILIIIMSKVSKSIQIPFQWMI